MKVIDIMQKVANKEIFKFRINDINYYVDKSNHICEEDGTKVEWYIDDEWLNMNAEVIEEDKKIEKLETYDIAGNIFLEDCCFKYIPIDKEKLTANEQVFADKINEIIDYIMEEK